MSEENPLQQDAQAPGTTLKATQELLTRAHAELGRVIAGQGEVIGQVLVAVLTQGHALLEGVPGIAKTLIVKSVGRLLGLSFQRVQGTPDLMPADILGTTISRRPCLYRHFASRRDQPHAPAHSGGAAGMHGRAPGNQRRRRATVAAVVHGLRHPEPHRF